MGTLQKLIDNFVLLQEHRDKLAVNRGFNTDTINKYQLKSCHPDNSRVIKELEKELGSSELGKEGIYIPHKRNQGVWVPNPQLLEDNILIPYLDENDEIIKIRPHLLGFSGQPSMVYRTKSSYKSGIYCIIAESEFKAIAAECFGYMAIGIPGISSMSGKNLNYFLDILDTIKAEEFIICFDNEIKDNPKYDNYKPDWRRRYDTSIFAYAMAKKILDYGKNCKISVLPDEWRKNGKIDIDGALAQGRSSVDFTRVINNAMPIEKFLQDIPVPEKHKPWISKKIRGLFSVSNVEPRSDGFYTKTTVDPKTFEKIPGKKLTNCTIKIANMYEVQDGLNTVVHRDIKITDEYGIDSKLIPLRSNQMVNKNAFSAWLMSYGNYLFYGLDKDVTMIWEYIFNNDESNIVYLVNKCGLMRDYNFFIFDNCIIKDGIIHEADKEGICWTDEIGYKINRLNTLDSHANMPRLNTETPELFDVNRFIKCLSDTCDYEYIGTGKALFAWTIGSLFSDIIFNKYFMYPILNLYGRYSGGKSTVMRWLLSFFGDPQAQCLSKSLGTRGSGNSTPVGISRALDYYSSMPFIVEDWRDTPEHLPFLPLFLGAYGRQGGIKGIKRSFGTNEMKINSTLGILGEDIINDSGVNSRCISIHMPEIRLEEHFDELNILAQSSSSFLVKLIKNYDSIGNSILHNMEKQIEKFKDITSNVNKRILYNYCILGAVYSSVIGEDYMLNKYISTIVTERSLDVKTDDKVQQFAEDFSFGVAEGYLQSHHYRYDENSRLVLWAKGINDVMNKYYNRKSDQFKLMIKQLTNKKYYIRSIKTSFQGIRGLMPAVLLDLEKMPENIRILFEAGNDSGNEAEKRHLNIIK